MILDIHTHHPENPKNAIINYPLLADSSLHVLPLAGSDEDCFYSAGIHPWELTAHNAEEQWNLLKKLIPKEKFVAIGEAGLDKRTAAPMKLQIQMFEKQVELAEERQLPLIVHCVKAMDELLEIKKRSHAIQPWIWHGFRGKPEQAGQLLQKGFYLSFGAHYSDDTLSCVPAERLLLETDDARLDIEYLLSRAAKVRGVKNEALRETLRGNVQKVFFKGEVL